jgi:hypothetical protein
MANYKIYEFYKPVIKGGQYDWLPLDFGFICNPADLPAIKWSEFLDIKSRLPDWVKQHLKIYTPKNASEIDLRANNTKDWTVQDAVEFYHCVLDMLNCFLYSGADAPNKGVNFLQATKGCVEELWDNVAGGKKYLFDIYTVLINTQIELDEPIKDEEVTGIFNIGGKTYILPTWAIEKFANQVLPIYLQNPEILTFRQGVEALAIKFNYSIEQDNLLQGKPMTKGAYIDEITGLLASLLVEIKLTNSLPNTTLSNGALIKPKHKQIQNFEYIGDRFAKDLYAVKDPTPEKQAHWAERFKERKKAFANISLKEAQKAVFFLTISTYNYTNTHSINSSLLNHSTNPMLRLKHP